MHVLAEGIETAEQQQFLRVAGVHSYQGFLFSRPQDAATISQRLAA
jgi:EAL domain-containing protein (putative c-di-GMP-specific phosphodiesterase class I)